MPEPLDAALAGLRPLLLDAGSLVRAIASGRRRGTNPAYVRGELRPVDLRGVRHLQVMTTDGRTPTTRNLTPEESPGAVDALLAQPFGSWHVETTSSTVQLRVTKGGQAQVHRASAARTAPAAHDRPKQHLIEPGDLLFQVLGADGPKRRQVDAFLRQLAPPARRLASSGTGPVRVVDLGCGNAYLTMAAHRFLSTELSRPVQTVGIDVRPEMATRNAALAAEIGLEGITFEAAPIDSVLGRPVDVALALHACDTATDDALALAVRAQASVVLAAPCCHHDIQAQLDSAAAPSPFPGLLRHAILSERFADVLTDALRADLLRLLGYRVEVVEFIDSAHTPRNALIRALRTGSPASPRRVTEYLELQRSWQVDPVLGRLLHDELAPVLATAR